MATGSVSTRRFFPPWLFLTAGALVVIATYAYLVIARPPALYQGGSGGSTALLALGGYLIGAVLIIAGAMSRLSTSTVALFPVAIAINIVIGQITNVTGLPLYLDSIGTVLVGVLAGPAAGAATGALANIIWGISINPVALPFAITQVVIGSLAGLFARWGTFRRWWTTVPAGLLMGIVAAVVSSPIVAFVYGNADASAARTGVGAVFQAYTNSLLQAAALQVTLFNSLDKVLIFLLVFLILGALPARLRERFPFARRFGVFGRRERLADQAAPADQPASAEVEPVDDGER
jgi:energy-coupling factor transport system substrate-specific component